MAKVEGLDIILKNIDNKKKAVFKATREGMDYSLQKTQDHIKTEYVWSKTHKGFNDRTANLRNSINHQVETVAQAMSKGHVLGWEYATMEYAPYVELRWEGKHAYLYPGVRDMRDEILDIIQQSVETAVKTLGV